MNLQPELAEAAIERLAEQLGLSAPETASGIIRIANASMTAATHLISVERGYDPRDFAFVSGGGAGGLHAVEIARELGMPNVVVPRRPGVTSALGILQVDLRHDFLRPVLQQTKLIEPGSLGLKFAQLETEARQILDAESIPADRQVVERSVDVRYYGQTPYMNLRLEVVPDSGADLDALAVRYRAAYEREYGYRLPEDMAAIEVVNARVAAIGLAETTELRRSEESGTADEALRGRRPVFFEDAGDFVDTPVYDRELLKNGATFEGPAVLEQSDTTILVPPGAGGRVDEYLNIVIETDGLAATSITTRNGAAAMKGA
jgi:N-methylhydantoinase A